MTDIRRMSQMKIKDAKENYRKAGFDSIEPDYISLVNTWKTLCLTEPIPNSDYLHGLYLMDLILRQTKQTIRMLNGPGKDGWLDVLKDTFEQAIIRIKAANGFLKAIFLADEAPELIVEWQKKYPDCVKYKLAKFIDASQLRHFISCDGLMLRLEHPHEELTPDSDTNIITADMYFRNQVKAEAMESYFDNLWSSPVLIKNK